MSKTGKGGKTKRGRRTMGRQISAGNVSPLDSASFLDTGLDAINQMVNAAAVAYARGMGAVKIVDKSTPATPLDEARFLKAQQKRNRRAMKRISCHRTPQVDSGSGLTPSS